MTYYTDKPFVVNRGNTSAELVDISNALSPVVFGGGSQGSPAGNFQIISATFSGNMEPEEQRGLGLQRNRLAGSGPVTGTIVIEEGLLTNASAFDPYALRRTGAALEWRCLMPMIRALKRHTLMCGFRPVAFNAKTLTV